MAVSPDGSRVYVANSNSSTVSVINTVTNTVVATIPAGSTPYGVAVSRDGGLIYVTNTYVDNVSIVNTATYALVATIPVGIEPYGISVSPDGSRVYVTDVSGNSVSVINTLTDLVISSIPAGGNPYGVAVSPDGNRVYVANETSNSVWVTDMLTNTIKIITVGEGPFGVAISSDGSRLYVANSGTGAVGNPPPGTVSVINTTTNSVIAIIGVGKGPTGLSFSPDGSEVYVTNNYDNTVSVVSTADNAVIATIPVGVHPSSLGNFIAGGTGCGGSTITYTITVIPQLLPPSITTDIVKGSISACEGTASSSPDVQQFNVSGAKLTGNIIVEAPAGFEVSADPAAGYSSKLSIIQSGGTVSSTVVYVRSAATAAKGSISGNVTLSSAGASSQEVAVTAIINAVTIVNPVGDQTVNSGGITKAVNFTGTGDSYTWTNDTPGIGLAASGTGNIAPFRAVNSSSSPVSATITVTPLAKSGRFAYVANAGSNTVSVINTATNQVTAEIPVGLQPEGVSVSPDGSRIYVTNGLSNSVSVINAATNSVIAVIPVGPQPAGVCVSPDGSKLYVCNSIDVSVINTAANIVIATIPVGEYPNEIAVSPDGSRLYVTNASGDSKNVNGNSNLYVIDTATNTVVSTIEVGQVSNGVAVSPNSKLVYVANTFSNDISVINTATNTVAATIPVGTGPWGICISPDGSRVYETNSGDQSAANLAPGTMSVINTATNTVTATIPVDTYPIGISVSLDGSQVYVANDFGKAVAGSGQDFGGTVSVINTASNTVKTTVSVGYNSISIGNFISNDTGCSGLPVTFTITVNPAGSVITTGPIAIPNTFTPNGDGINDNWDIKNLDSYLNCTVDVFNRWGQSVYSSIGYGTPWDGTYGGKKLPTGPYYYIINLKNGLKPYSGSITIVR